MTAVQGTSARRRDEVPQQAIVAEPGTACTETYLVAGRFATEAQQRQTTRSTR
jgi:site-specific DNA-methyltransferase (adenine-specific)